MLLGRLAPVLVGHRAVRAWLDRNPRERAGGKAESGDGDGDGETEPGGEGLGGHGGFLLSLGGLGVHTHETGRRGYFLQPRSTRLTHHV